VVADLAVGGHDDMQLGRAGVELHIVEGDDVGGVGRRNLQARSLTIKDQHAAALRDGPRQGPDVVGDDDRAAEIDQREPEGLRERLGDLPFGGQAEVDDDGPQPATRLAGGDIALGIERGHELFSGQQALRDEDLADPAAGAPGCGSRFELGHGAHPAPSTRRAVK
jgi:hypothetical protein